MVNNPFKVGDKVVQCKELDTFVWQDTGFGTRVCEVRDVGVYLTGGPFIRVVGYPYWVDASNFRAAIAGVDYPATKRDDNLPLGAVIPADRHGTPLQPTGHLSDGSSVQKHSAGGLYPVVIWHRDKKLPGAGKYDVGLTWPDQAEPVWFRDYDSAINVAEAIKESLK